LLAVAALDHPPFRAELGDNGVVVGRFQSAGISFGQFVSLMWKRPAGASLEPKARPPGAVGRLKPLTARDAERQEFLRRWLELRAAKEKAAHEVQ
jgi:hypothetical protein